MDGQLQVQRVSSLNPGQLQVQRVSSLNPGQLQAQRVSLNPGQYSIKLEPQQNTYRIRFESDAGDYLIEHLLVLRHRRDLTLCILKLLFEVATTKPTDRKGGYTKEIRL